MAAFQRLLTVPGLAEAKALQVSMVTAKQRYIVPKAMLQDMVPVGEVSTSCLQPRPADTSRS